MRADRGAEAGLVPAPDHRQSGSARSVAAHLHREQVRTVRLDGSYLHCEKRLGHAGPFDPIWFEPTRQAAVAAFLDAEAKEFLPALEQTAAIIDGFESPLGMELLATVDWLLARAGCEATVPGLRRGLEGWPGGRSAARRKLQIFDERLLELALRRLTEVPVGGGSN